MKKYLSPLLMLVIAAFVMAPGWVQAHEGVYISSDIGLNIASGVETAGASNDGASHCDALLNPNVMTDCTGDQGGDFPYPGNQFFEDWWNDFSSGQGILAGAAVGYSFAKQNPNSPLGGLRVEMEYFYRQSKYDETRDITRAGGASLAKIRNGELATVTDRVGSITSHNLFANLYYDFANTSRFTPYIGVGGGLGFTDMGYGSLWARTLNKDTIRNGLTETGRPDLAANNAYIDNLAGSTSSAQTTLSDTLWGFQVLFGVDYAITEAMSLGLKGRWVMFNDFRDNIVWDPLRGHAPYVGGTPANPTNPVSGYIDASNIQFFGISLNMKYHF
ncbi:MAG: hypothetical protein OXI53_00350 [Nitrospira sp.]|nr:hypothetical protein [Nitrospira sp.]